MLVLCRRACVLCVCESTGGMPHIHMCSDSVASLSVWSASASVCAQYAKPWRRSRRDQALGAPRLPWLVNLLRALLCESVQPRLMPRRADLATKPSAGKVLSRVALAGQPAVGAPLVSCARLPTEWTSQLSPWCAKFKGCLGWSTCRGALILGMHEATPTSLLRGLRNLSPRCAKVVCAGWSDCDCEGLCEAIHHGLPPEARLLPGRGARLVEN